MIQDDRPAPPASYQALDLLCTLMTVLDEQGAVLFANAALENALGLSRRMLEGSELAACFTEPALLDKALRGAQDNDFAALRFEASLHRVGGDALPVHVTVSLAERPGHVLVEFWPLEQQARQDREERLREQAQAHKELIRNLAHEIKNPLGGIRGSAQLLEMELNDKELTEYTQVIIHEADRLQTLVDRLLAPHRRPHVVGDVNIHEVCERVRSLILAEFPKGLKVVRDYDISIPEFRGDREQLIQAVLNIAHNAAQAAEGKRHHGFHRDHAALERAAFAAALDLGNRHQAVHLHGDVAAHALQFVVGERDLHRVGTHRYAASDHNGRGGRCTIGGGCIHRAQRDAGNSGAGQAGAVDHAVGVGCTEVDGVSHALVDDGGRRAVGGNRGVDVAAHRRPGDGDVVDADPLVIAHCVGGDDAHLHQRLIGGCGGEHCRYGRRQCGQTGARSGVCNETGGHIDEQARVAHSVLQGNRHHCVVGGAVQVTQQEPNSH